MYTIDLGSECCQDADSVKLLNDIIILFLFSSVHDHADSHCFMKVLGGTLKETQFHWPNEDEVDRKRPLKEKESKEYLTNAVTYINGTFENEPIPIIEHFVLSHINVSNRWS